MAGKEEKIDYIFPIFYSLQQPWASFFGMEKAIYRLPERKVTEFVVEGGKIRGTWPAGHFFQDESPCFKSRFTNGAGT